MQYLHGRFERVHLHKACSVLLGGFLGFTIGFTGIDLPGSSPFLPGAIAASDLSRSIATTQNPSSTNSHSLIRRPRLREYDARTSPLTTSRQQTIVPSIESVPPASKPASASDTLESDILVNQATVVADSAQNTVPTTNQSTKATHNDTQNQQAGGTGFSGILQSVLGVFGQSFSTQSTTSAQPPSTFNSSVTGAPSFSAGSTGGDPSPHSRRSRKFTEIQGVAAVGSPTSPSSSRSSPPPPSSPMLSVSPTSLSFTATQGGANPNNQTITVTNAGSGTLAWTAGTTQSWLSVLTSGSAITATVNTSSVTAGNYSGAIVVSDSNASNSPQVVPVSLTVTTAPVPPTISVSPTSLSFSATEGSPNPAAQTITVSNSGGGTLSWAGSDNQPWLNVSPFGSTITATVNTVGLTPGSYSGTISVTDPAATNSPQTVPVTFNIAAAPVIGLSPTSLTFTATAGGANPSNQTVTVSNTGGGTLSYTASDNQPWLSVSSSGSTMTVSVTSAGLAANSYSGTITVSSSNALNSPQTVPVVLTVTASPVPPAISVSPTSLLFSGTQGSPNPAAQIITVSNSGGGLLNWSVSDNQPWLHTTTSGDTVNVTVSIGSAGVGTNTGTITVTDPAATNSPQTIPVTLTVGIAPVLSLNPTNLSFNATAGGANPASQTITVSNTGGGTLSWTVSDNRSWLSVSPSGSTMTATVNISGLSAGSHSGTITVTDAAASNSPQTVPVTLTLGAAPAIGLSSTSLSFTATASSTNPAAQTITVSNTGGGTLSWSASDNKAWLTVSQSGSTITASVNVAGLTAGSHSGTITVSDSGASNSPQTVSVTLTLNAPPTQSATLTWNANNTEPDLAGYHVFRKTTSGASYSSTPHATISAGTTTYLDTGLLVGNTYFYVLTAFDTSGNDSAYSNEDSKTIF